MARDLSSIPDAAVPSSSKLFSFDSMSFKIWDAILLDDDLAALVTMNGTSTKRRPAMTLTNMAPSVVLARSGWRIRATAMRTNSIAHTTNHNRGRNRYEER